MNDKTIEDIDPVYLQMQSFACQARKAIAGENVLIIGRTREPSADGVSENARTMMTFDIKDRENTKQTEAMAQVIDMLLEVSQGILNQYSEGADIVIFYKDGRRISVNETKGGQMTETVLDREDFQ